MVFSSSEEEHVKHVASFLKRLRENNLFVKYLRYVVSSDGLKMDSSRVQQILNCPQPKNIKALQSFLGFANFYCCFIKNSSKKSLLSLPFIKKTLPLSPMRKLLVNDSGKHPIAFDSCKIFPSDLNYEIHDKELLGIVWALRHWSDRPLFASVFHVFQYSYSLSGLLGGFFSEFYCTIPYHPGRLSTLPDALSRQDNMYPERGVDFISNNPQNFHQVIKQDGIQESRFFSIKVEIFSDLAEKIQKELLLIKDRVVIPRNEEIQLNILQKHHNSPLAGHPGQEKTLKLIKRDFHWAVINQFIKDYLSSCQQCSRNKNIHHKNFGLLKPLQIPSVLWNSLSMDFITQLPLSNKFNSILVAVDRFSQMAIFIPTYGTITSLELSQIFISHVSSKHGLPVKIVSDRVSSFVSSFWTNLSQ
ncbi:hypothetical protein O181_031475 [Austropuccinia psidii MF-1]|uniref:Integrase catalytic domain-containing protein n=1 Tax=Austropuccinia psidii MF-1 TaxID=1389203 RepID=A0A9Q3CY09_9BASI|nr:hypothetical protein [Austropuccinia psidii MF-1]